MGNPMKYMGNHEKNPWFYHWRSSITHMRTKWCWYIKTYLKLSDFGQGQSCWYIYIFQHHGSHIGVDKIWYLLIHCWDSFWCSKILKRIAPKDRHSRIASPLNVQWLWQSISSDVFLRCPNGHLKILKQNLQMTAVACCGSTTIYKRCVDVSRRGHRGKNLSIRAAFAPSLAPSVPAK